MLPGPRAALNYHAMFVHFPIVLWLIPIDSQNGRMPGAVVG